MKLYKVLSYKNTCVYILFYRSERVSKTGVNGLLLQEAKYINLSLHFLEQVISKLLRLSNNDIEKL